MFLKLLKHKNEGYPEVSNLHLLVFCTYVIIWFLQVGSRFQSLGAIRIELIWAIFLTMLIVFNNDKVSVVANPLAGITALFFLVMIVQVPFSYVPAHSWDVFLNRVIKFSFMSFVIVQCVRSPKGLMFFIGAFMLACMKMGQEGLVGRLTGSMIWENQGIMRLHGSTSLYAHPNSFSGMALGTLPFVLFLFPHSTKIVKLLLVVSALLSLNIVIYTGSRTGYMALVGLLLFMFFKSKHKFISISLVFVFVFGLLSFADPQYIGRFNSSFTGHEASGHSSKTRIQIIKDAWVVFQENPLGIGLSAFPAFRTDRFGRFQDIHNLYLEIATNLGIQGLVIFMILIYKIFKCLIFLRYKFSKDIIKLRNVVTEGAYMTDIRTHISDLSFVCAVIDAIITYLILRLIMGLFGQDLYEIYWWFAIGLTIAIFNIEEFSSKKTFKLLND